MNENLLLIQKLVFDKLKLQHSNVVTEPQSANYGACEFELNKLRVKFRVAKITPTKIGQFVTLWQRSAAGPIIPFNYDDKLKTVIIYCSFQTNIGYFIFPKSVLCKQGIISSNGKCGKLAIRVYPPWDKVIAKQAQQTQQWQLNYFFNLSNNQPLNLTQAKYALEQI